MSRATLSRAASVGALLLACATAFGAVKPLSAPGPAARAVTTALLVREDVQMVDQMFVYSARDIAARAFRQLAAATTVQALLAAPGGIVVNCPESGTLAVRLPNRWPRVLKLEWQHCSRLEFGFRDVQHGPGEIVLLEDSLVPAAIASVRFGERNRDFVEDFTTDRDLPGFIHSTVYWNARLSGYLPLQRLGDDAQFAGRYLAQVSGFHRDVSEFPDYSTGEPSVERYPFVTTVSTSGALLTGEFTHTANTNTFGFDVSLVAGDFDHRYESPVTPSAPAARDVHKSFGGTGLRLAWGSDEPRALGYFSIDGAARTDYNAWWGFGCAKPDEFSYRTRARLEYLSADYTGHMFDRGQITLNGTTTAAFTATGTTPFFDRVGHVALDIPRVGSFNYDVNGFVYGSALLAAGVCTP